MTSLLFVHVGDAGVTSFTSGFASESASKPDSLDSRIRIRIRALNGRGFTESNPNPASDSVNRIRRGSLGPF